MKEMIYMLRYKKKFVCEKCGRVFYEYIGDCIMPETAELLTHPKCRKCRLISKLTKGEKQYDKTHKTI